MNIIKEGGSYRTFESNITQNSKSIHVRNVINVINVRLIASNVISIIQIQCHANRTIKRDPLGIQTQHAIH